MESRRVMGAVFALACLAAAGGAVAVEPSSKGYVPTDAERARWTMADMRTLGIALEAYKADNGSYPQAASLTEAIAKIEPMYVRKAPSHDAWGTGFKYMSEPEGAGYRIVSAGADRTFDESSWSREGEAEGFEEDAILKNGRLVGTWPYR